MLILRQHNLLMVANAISINTAPAKRKEEHVKRQISVVYQPEAKGIEVTNYKNFMDERSLLGEVTITFVITLSYD